MDTVARARDSEDGAAETLAVDPAAPDAPSDPLARSLTDSIDRARSLLAESRAQAVRGDDRWPEAGRKVLRLHFARMLVRTPGAIAGDDPEDVHAMRVASRRMRAAWRVYGTGYEGDSTRRYRAHLREVGGRLGAVRDRDVLIAMLDDHADRHGSRAARGLLPLRVAWVADRESYRAELAAFLASDAFVGFVDEHESFLAAHLAEVAGDARDASAPVRQRMPATAWTAYADVMAFADLIATADLATLHRLRIAGKWYRYTLESVRECLAADGSALIEPVVALQDHLGDQHDRHVAAALARDHLAGAAGLTPKESAQIQRLVDALDERVDWLGQRLDRTWDPLMSPRYRARLGRSLGRL